MKNEIKEKEIKKMRFTDDVLSHLCFVSLIAKPFIHSEDMIGILGALCHITNDGQLMSMSQSREVWAISLLLKRANSMQRHIKLMVAKSYMNFGQQNIAQRQVHLFANMHTLERK